MLGEYLAQWNVTHLVLNNFAHFNFSMRRLEACYRDVGLTKYTARARNDGLRFWRYQIGSIASLLRRRYPTITAIYRTSPEASEFYLRPKDTDLEESTRLKPLDDVGVLEDAANAEFNHDVVRQMNNIAVGSFLGAGLEVIDMETVFLGFALMAIPPLTTPEALATHCIIVHLVSKTLLST